MDSGACGIFSSGSGNLQEKVPLLITCIKQAHGKDFLALRPATDFNVSGPAGGVLHVTCRPD